MALVIGTQAMVTPTAHMGLVRAGMLSPSSRSATFDESADGYARSEGCVALVLALRAEQSLPQHLLPLAEIVGSAVNHAGASSNGLTAPSASAQERVIRSALSDAGVTADRVSYVEAHGTGTPLGDPIEMDVLTRVYGREATEQLLIGALKTNVGHLEAAAGAAGVLKTALVLAHRQVPPNLHFSQLNRHIAALKLPECIRFPTRTMHELHSRVHGEPIVAGVSSFGFSGTNVHLIMREATTTAATVATTATSRSSSEAILVVPVAAITPTSCQSLLGQYAEYFRDASHDRVASAFTAATCRDHQFPAGSRFESARARKQTAALYRSAVVATVSELANAIEANVRANANQPPRKPTLPRHSVAFMFSGQGVKEAHQLFDAISLLRQQSLVFGATFSECLGHLEPPVSLDQLAVNATEKPVVTQVVLLAFLISLARLWQSWGVQPVAVFGHSLGEVAASVTAGALSVSQAMRLVHSREAAMARYAVPGSMVAVMASSKQVQLAIDHVLTMSSTTHRESVVLAISAINSPTQTVVSGDEHSIERLISFLSNPQRDRDDDDDDRQQSKVLRCIRLPNVAHAYHSPLIGEGVRSWCADEVVHRVLEQSESRQDYLPIALFSSTTASKLEHAQARTMDHWANHALGCVNFYQTAELVSKSVDVMLEIGSAAVLAATLQRALGSSSTSQQLQPVVTDDGSVGPIPMPLLVMPSFYQPSPNAWHAILVQVGRLYEETLVPIDWQAVYRDLVPTDSTRVVDHSLPTYAFERVPLGLSPHPYRIKPALASSREREHRGDTQHTTVSVTIPPQVASQHHVEGSSVVPAATQLLAVWPEVERAGLGAVTLELVTKGVLEQVDGVAHVNVHEFTHQQWRVSCHSKETAVCTAVSLQDYETSVVTQQQLVSGIRVDSAAFYKSLSTNSNLAYGPQFQLLDDIVLDRQGMWVSATVRVEPLSQEHHGNRHDLLVQYSNVLDACFHLAAALCDPRTTRVPIRLQAVSLDIDKLMTAKRLRCVHYRRIACSTESELVSLLRVSLMEDDEPQRTAPKGEVVVIRVEQYTTFATPQPQQISMLNLVQETLALPLRRRLEVNHKSHDILRVLLVSPESGSTLHERFMEQYRMWLEQHRHVAPRDIVHVRVSAAEQLAEVLNRLAASTTSRSRLAVVFGANDVALAYDTDADREVSEFDSLARDTCGSLLHVLQQLVQCDSLRGSIDFCTLILPNEEQLEGHQSLKRLVSECLQAAAVGVLRVATSESSGSRFHGWSLEIEPAIHVVDGNSPVLEQVFQVLASGGIANEDSLRLDRNGAWNCPRLVTSPYAFLGSRLPSSPSRLLQEEQEEAIVFGGFGGIGLHVVAWLLEGHLADIVGPKSKHVVIAGHRVHEHVIERLVEMLGTHVTIEREPCDHDGDCQQSYSVTGAWATKLSLVQCDITDVASVSSLLSRYRHPSIAIHSAATLHDVALHDLEWQSFLRGSRTKALGAVVLDRLLPASVPLVLFSSVSVTLRTAGQASYVAANEFVERLGARRRAAGRPTAVIQWGLWQDVGMAVASVSQDDARRQVWRSPARPMSAADIRPLFAQALCQSLREHLASSATVVIAALDWATLAEQQRSQAQRAATTTILSSLWQGWIPVVGSDQDQEDTDSSSIEPVDRVVQLQDALVGAISSVLEMDATTIGRERESNRPLVEFGLDSLALMELRQVLHHRTGRLLPMRTLRAPTFVSILEALQRVEIDATPVSHRVEQQLQGTTTTTTTITTTTEEATMTEETRLGTKNRWLIPILGDPFRARTLIVAINDAGGDPLNFGAWKSEWRSGSDTAVVAVHFPGHTSRAHERPCASLAEASTGIIEALMQLPCLDPSGTESHSPKQAVRVQPPQEQQYVMFGQCIGAYYCLRVAEEIRRRKLRQPLALFMSSCPGPTDMHVLTRYTDGDEPEREAARRALLSQAERDALLQQGLHDLTLAIGFSEDDWQRVVASPTMYKAVVNDVRMTDLSHGVTRGDAPLPVAIVCLLGCDDPVVAPHHLSSWLQATSRQLIVDMLPNLGHNIQYEPATVRSVQRHLDFVLAQHNQAQ